MELTLLLRDQKRELDDWLKKKKIVEREAHESFKDVVASKLIKVIIGARRCGKSVLSYAFLQNEKFAYMNFDDERLTKFDTDEILSSFQEIYGKNVKNILFDEIQNLDKWELFSNRLKRQGFNIYITGSNSRLLSKELATHLTGRHITIELFPFSFKEYLKAMDFKEDTETTIGKGAIKRELENYLNNGGFPEVVVEKEDPKRYLRELYGRIVERDIISRYDIAYKKTFREIAIVLLSNPGRKISYNKIKKQFNIKSEHTIKNYISYLEEAYMIFLLNRFSFKPVEIEKSEKKIYAIDTGIINNVSIKHSQDYGRLYENLVALEFLRKKSFNPNLEFYYWKNIQHEEVDFVVKEKLKVGQLIQVCYDISDIDTKKRELRALLKASKELKCSNLLVITEDKEGEEKIKNKKIKYIPLWKWLLK
ncbi:ATP-binding protein [Candidatus Woesearchaeota archaeon]|nr:ATP-binding protein [Candidatus Woesearchaeota archaeon]